MNPPDNDGKEKSNSFRQRFIAQEDHAKGCSRCAEPRESKDRQEDFRQEDRIYQSSHQTGKKEDSGQEGDFCVARLCRKTGHEEGQDKKKGESTGRQEDGPFGTRQTHGTSRQAARGENEDECTFLSDDGRVAVATF